MKYTSEKAKEMLAALRASLSHLPFDQYRLYKASNSMRWMEYLLRRFEDHLERKDGGAFFEIHDGVLFLVGYSVPSWDLEHFGFPMAKIDWMICPDVAGGPEVMKRVLDECMIFLREYGVRFISSHSGGEDLCSLHLLESKGFRYSQSTVYSIAECAALPHRVAEGVRLWEEADLPRVVEIARGNQFPYGHFYTDNRFEKKVVDSMYEKWIRTSWDRRDPIAVIEKDGFMAGYFAFVMDKSLSDAMGVGYGRMTSLAMDSSIRSKGLGSDLFTSVIAKIATNGARYVVSEHPLRNYASGWLHTKNRFFTVYEKVLMHLWL